MVRRLIPCVMSSLAAFTQKFDSEGQRVGRANQPTEPTSGCRGILSRLGICTVSGGFGDREVKEKFLVASRGLEG